MKKALIIIVTSLQVLLLCCCEKPETTGQDAQQTSDKVVMIANTSTHDVSVEIFHHSQQIKPFSYWWVLLINFSVIQTDRTH